MIKIIKGNLLQATEDIIGHQVNCLGVMGAGVAKQIAQQYPNVLSAYKKLCVENTNNKEMLLGTVQLINISDDQAIANIFGQVYTGTNKCYTNYKALEKAFSELNKIGKSVALPYKIGCGLAGGDWNIVLKIIEENCKNIDVTLYNYET